MDGGEYSFVICIIISSQKIMDSIKNKLFTLPYTTTVLCGHGPITTLGEEMAENPFVKEFLVCFKQ